MGCGPGHIARYLKDAGTSVFGLDLSPGMIEQCRQLNPDISFQVGDMMALEFGDESLAGIVAFYAIVNIPRNCLPSVFREIARALEPGGLLLLAFHVGDEILHPEEVLDQPNSIDWFFFQPNDIRRYLEAAALAIEETIVREPYAPEVEYQSRRAYIFARKSVQLHK
jgi:SAM-dependent methyltransferase